jgi:F0F1-type ATP synthase membrane subunit c/vacuolar-type H+-ATPase subunit K
MFNELLASQTVDLNILSQALIVCVFIIAAVWAMNHGSTINASAEVEGKSTVWGTSLNAFGVFMLLLSIFFSIFIILGGGEGMIPETAWPLITGALTLIGTGFAAALAVMVAAKAGAEMLTQRPELSIWSLLFVALGEGLAIYGLIITILMISKGG